MKLHQIDQPMIPDWSKMEEKPNKPLLIVNVLVLIVSTIKVLSLLRMYESIGNMIALIRACLTQVLSYLAFLFLFIITISAFYKLLGANFNTLEYPEVGSIGTYIM